MDGAATSSNPPGVTELGTLGRYELIAKLATGGMGEIFLARLAGEGGFEKLIVLKRLLPELVASEHFVAMFLDEARIAAKLSHSNVCEVYELGKDGATYFIAMQYLEGVAVSAAMELASSLTPAEHARFCAGVLQQACEGLHHAHELRDADGRSIELVHRDVSPSNLFITAEGIVKVLDFGIAKARGATSQTEQGMIKGKYSYMSPEQVRGDELDRRSDVFALGIVGYELATGARLFKRPSDYLVAKAILEERIPSVRAACPRLPAAMAHAIERALARDPADRHATARELGVALGAATAALGGPMTPPEIAGVIERAFATELGAQRVRYAEASALAERATQSHVAHAAVTAPTRPARPASLRPRPRRRGRALAWVAVAAVAAAAIAVGALSTRCGGVTAGSEAAAAADATPAVVLAIPPDAAPPPRPDAAPKGPTDAAPQPRPSPERPRPAARFGFVSFESTPYATIYVDGRRLGVTPLIRRRVRAGRRSVRAVLEDGRQQRFTVDVPAGESAPPQLLSW